MNNKTHINLELISNRMTVDDMDFVKNLEKERNGVLGENITNALLNRLIGSPNYLRNVLLSYDGSYFQIDHLVVTNDRAIIMDSKYYNFDFEICNGRWTFNDGKQASNPIDQLERAKNLLHKWLTKRNIRLPVWGYVVWTGCGQIYGMNKQDVVISTKKAEWILSNIARNEFIDNDVLNFIDKERIIKSPFYRHIDLSDDYLPGLNCPSCYKMTFEGKRKRLTCTNCGDAFDLHELIYRNVLYYCSLHDTETFSISEFHRFIGDQFSKRTIQRVFNDLLCSSRFIRINNIRYKLPAPIELLL